MVWRWETVGKARKGFAKLDGVVARRIAEKLDFWVRSEKPLDFAEPLKDFELGSYRFRVGDYRIVFDVEGETIVVLSVGHRKEIYR